MMRTPRVSVIIAAYHSDSTIASCLKALRLQTFGDFETIVVNSSRGDRTREIVTTQFPEVKFIENPTRLLPHAARNRGVLQAVGQILVFTDADCRGSPDWLERLVKAHAAGREVLCGSIEPAAGSGWFELGVHLCKYSFRLSALPGGPCAIAGTANASCTLKVWNTVGPFEENRFASDGLLSWRAANQGWQPWFEPRAIVHHVFRHSWLEFWFERIERGADFAEARTTFEEWSRLRLFMYLVTFPLLPLIQLIRTGRDAFNCGWRMVFFSTMPIQFLGHLGWSLGEARVHWRLLKQGVPRTGGRTS